MDYLNAKRRCLFKSKNPNSASPSTFAVAPGGSGNHGPPTINDSSNTQVTTAEAISQEGGSEIAVLDPQRHPTPSHSKTAWEKAVESLREEDRVELCSGEPTKLRTLDEFSKDAEKKWEELKDLNDTEIMSNILSDMEHISRILARCAVYEKLYTDTARSAENLLKWLPDLYAAILLYLCYSKRYCSRKSTKRKFTASVDPYTAEFLPLMEEIKRQEASMEHAAGAAADHLQATITMRVEEMNSEQKKATADIQRLQGLLQSMQEGTDDKLQNISKELEGAERTEILRWLSNVTYEEHHQFTKSARQRNTGNWLFDKKHYIDWKQCASSAIFWLHVIAGAGKTTLASLMIDTVESTISTDDALAYFYCKYGESDRQDPRSIMRCIVKQLSLKANDGFLPEPVVSMYEKHKREGFKYEQLRLDESKDLILQLSEVFKQTFIVIDALDECDKDTRPQLIGDFKSLRSSAKGLKIFFTSRDDDDMFIFGRVITPEILNYSFGRRSKDMSRKINCWDSPSILV